MDLLEGFIGGLITAWILSWFGVNHMLITVMQPYFHGVTLTDAHYYIAFAFIGLIGEAYTHRNKKS